MDTQKSQIAERLKQANNILVTVSNNPSVDQLSAAIGITLLLNKLGKHAVSVFSGDVPSTIEFLQPNETFEKTTDSLRDFIIALDKSKADKLRYKVEDQMVKIFITPYRTSISDQDLEFSQGDFNVEVVLALGINEQSDLDKAIINHGRILHDATVISVNTQGSANLGSINWLDNEASSLSEMLVSLGVMLKADILDNQMATAFLTGIVAETNRFSNEKTSSETMQVSSKLMAAGANQQLIATQLQQPSAEVPLSKTDEKKSDGSSDGSLEIDHDATFDDNDELPEPEIEQIHISEEGEIGDKAEEDTKPTSVVPKAPTGRGLALEPPSLGGKLTANSEPEGLDPSTDPLGDGAHNPPILSRKSSTPPKNIVPLAPEKTEEPPKPPVSVPEVPMPPPVFEAPMPSPVELPSTPPVPLPSPVEQLSTTLSDLEKSVQSAHVQEAVEPPTLPAPQPEAEKPAPAPQNSSDLDAARDAVLKAVQGSEQTLAPVQALNAQPVDLNQFEAAVPSDVPLPPPPVKEEKPVEIPPEPAAEEVPKTDTTPSDPGLPPGLIPMTPPVDNTASAVTNPTAPPPVPPPLMPPETPEQQPPPGIPDDERPLTPPVL